MKKSIRKRIRITKNGKLIRRSMSMGHFRTRTTQKNIRNKRKSRSMDFLRKKIVRY